MGVVDPQVETDRGAFSAVAIQLTDPTGHGRWYVVVCSGDHADRSITASSIQYRSVNGFILSQAPSSDDHQGTCRDTGNEGGGVAD